MKSSKSARKLVLGLLAVGFALFFIGCEKESSDSPSSEQNIIPARFSVDIPSSLSGSSSTLKSTSLGNTGLKSASDDTLSGNEIYENLKLFIAIGKGAADITESIIWHIRALNIERVLELTYESDDDERTKRLVVKKDVSFEDRIWDYQLTITDVLSEGDLDGGIAMQVFWNNAPIEGIAMLKPTNINNRERDENRQAMFRIDYSEKATASYDSHMIVQIANLPTDRIWDDQYAINAIKMFVGKKGNVVDVYGNSNHPNAEFFTDETGFNWAFVASSLVNSDIAVAEVGLPPSTLNSTMRKAILEDYSIKSVFVSQISLWFLGVYGVTPSNETLSNYLKNADAPGYFANKGFIQGGTAPNNSYTDIEARLKLLTPYNPKDISELQLAFLK